MLNKATQQERKVNVWSDGEARRKYINSFKCDIDECILPAEKRKNWRINQRQTIFLLCKKHAKSVEQRLKERVWSKKKHFTSRGRNNSSYMLI